MNGTAYNQANQTIKHIADRILETGYLSRQEHFQLITASLSSLLVTEEERSLINSVFDELQMGHLKFIES